MVMFWRSWAERLTEEEKRQIEEISYGWAWLGYHKASGTYQGTFYYFPENSGYKDSPPIPAEIAMRHKTKFIGLDDGWLNEETRTFTFLTAVTSMFPKEMDELYRRYLAKIAEKREHVR